MKTTQWTRRLAAVSAVSLIAACSGGGGGGTISTAGPPSTPTPPPPAPPATVAILAPAPATFSSAAFPSSPKNFPAATGTTPDLVNNLPPTGTVFPFLQTALTFFPAQVQGMTSSTGVTLTLTGTQMVGGVAQPIFELKEQDIGLDVANINSSLTTRALPDGRQFQLALAGLTYSVYAGWGVEPTSPGSPGDSLFLGISGFQTPTSGVPTGTATYLGTGASGGVTGYVALPSGTGSVTLATLSGDANIGVNFSTGAVNGSLTNMTAQISGGSAAPWNNVSLTGTMSGSALSGTTAPSGTPPAGAASFGSGATGTFTGARFGPHGEELGAVWNLFDATGQGKSAIGFLGATKQ